MKPRVDMKIRDRVFEGWSPNNVKLAEAVAIERAYGQSWKQFRINLADDEAHALQVMAWTLLKRDDPNLRIDDMDLDYEDISASVMCDECSQPAVLVPVDPDDPDGNVHFVHVGGGEDCGPGSDAPFPTGAVDESPLETAELDTSPTSLTGSESDHGSGTD